MPEADALPTPLVLARVGRLAEEDSSTPHGK